MIHALIPLMKNHNDDINMPAEHANRKAKSEWRSISALYARLAWLCCGVVGEVDIGLRVSGGSVDVGAAEKEPVRNVCVGKESEIAIVVVAAALGDAAKKDDAWL